MAHRRRTRLTVLAVHVATSGVWLGLLTATALTPTIGPRIVVVMAPAAGVAVITGLVITPGLLRFGWVRAKLALTALIVALAGVTWELHLTGRAVAGARYTAVTVLLAATVVAVVKPHRTRRTAHETDQVVPRTETDQSDLRSQGRGMMDPRREPALILGLFAAAVQMVSAFVFHLTITQQGTLNAVAIAVAGLVTAISVKSDQLAPLILGLAQALLAVGLAFGLYLSPDNQSVIMSFVAAVVAMFIRTQVTAPAGAKLVPAGSVVA
jgi:hypothetical protein